MNEFTPGVLYDRIHTIGENLKSALFLPNKCALNLFELYYFVFLNLLRQSLLNSWTVTLNQ